MPYSLVGKFQLLRSTLPPTKICIQMVTLTLVCQNEIQHIVGGSTKCNYFIQPQNFDLQRQSLGY